MDLIAVDMRVAFHDKRGIPRYVRNFVRVLSEIGLKDLEVFLIIPSHQVSSDHDLESNFQFYQARVYLHEKNWPEAQKQFLKCLSIKNLKKSQKIFSALGFLSSFFRVDLISYTRRIKKGSPFAFWQRKVRK